MFKRISNRITTLLFAIPIWICLILFTTEFAGLNLDVSWIPLTGQRIIFILTSLLFKLFISLLLAFMVLNIMTYYKFARTLWQNKKLLIQLSVNDFKKKFVSSYLGSVWGFILPLIQIVTFWFVWEVGFTSPPIQVHSATGELLRVCPYVLWMIAGIIPWFFIADSILSGTSVFLEYSFLVKKIVFKIELLPFVKVLSAFYVHIFFIALLFIAFLFRGYPITIYSIQIIYYIICSFLLLFSLTLLFSTLNVFIRDVGQIVSVIIQVGFWVTPIGWDLATKLPSGILSTIFKMNPFYYIVSGYRDALVYQKWFWETPALTCYFWIFVMIVMLGSIKTYNRMKLHFADLI